MHETSLESGHKLSCEMAKWTTRALGSTTFKYHKYIRVGVGRIMAQLELGLDSKKALISGLKLGLRLKEVGSS